MPGLLEHVEVVAHTIGRGDSEGGSDFPDGRGESLLARETLDVAGVETESQLTDVGAELQDRYGEPPPAVRNLLDYASLKLLAVRVGATAIERKRDLMTIKFRENAGIDPEKLARFVSSQRGAQFTPDGTLKFALPVTAAGEVLNRLRVLLEQLASVLPQVASA